MEKGEKLFPLISSVTRYDGVVLKGGGVFMICLVKDEKAYEGSSYEEIAVQIADIKPEKHNNGSYTINYKFHGYTPSKLQYSSEFTPQEAMKDAAKTICDKAKEIGFRKYKQI